MGPMAAVCLLIPLLSGCIEDSSTSSGLGGEAKAPANLELVNTSVSNAKITLGQLVELTFTVKNSGEQDGAFAVQFLVNGAVKEEKTYRVIAAASETSTFSFSPASKGLFVLSLAASALGGRATSQVSAGPWTLDVTVPAELVIRSVSVSAREAEVSTPVTITATVANEGEETGSKEVSLFINGQVASKKPASVDPNSQVDVQFTYTNSARGDYAVRVDGYDAGSIQFYVPATFEAVSFTVSQTQVDVGDRISFSYEVKNSGDREGSVQLAILFDGKTVYGKQESIGPQQTKNGQTNQVTTESGGTKTASLTLAGVSSKQLQVTVRSPQLSGTNIETPWNSDYASYDHAFTSLTVRNDGPGKGKNVRVEFWVDGTKKSIEMGETTYSHWSIGELSAGGSRSSGQVKILGVPDTYGENDCYTFVAKVYGDYVPTWQSQGIAFCV